MDMICHKIRELKKDFCRMERLRKGKNIEELTKIDIKLLLLVDPT